MIVIELKNEHNHELYDDLYKHLLKTNRKIRKSKKIIANINQDAGISLISLYNKLKLASGNEGRINFTKGDLKNYLTKRKANTLKYGEASALLQYFGRKSC